MTADGSSSVDDSRRWRVRHLGAADRRDSRAPAEALPVAARRVLYGFAFTPDGRIVYQTLEAGQLDLAIMSSDGSGRQPLTNDPEADYYPRVTQEWLGGVLA